MLVHWRQYTDPGYLAFVDEAQPEVVQVGFYGVDFWAFSKRAQGGERPELLQTQPVEGDLKASGQFLENLNKELHKRGIKVIGHFDVEYHVTGLIDGPQGPREGFFKFYNELWDEKELGPKPVKDPLELLQRNADGSPLICQAAQGLLAVAALPRLPEQSELAGGPQGLPQARHRARRGRIHRQLLLYERVHVQVLRAGL
jgi:hypothetical protein